MSGWPLGLLAAASLALTPFAAPAETGVDTPPEKERTGALDDVDVEETGGASDEEAAVDAGEATDEAGLEELPGGVEEPRSPGPRMIEIDESGEPVEIPDSEAHEGEPSTEAPAAFQDVEDGEPIEVDVEVGGQLVLEAPGLERISVADPSVADVHVVDDEEVMVTGISQGRTTIHVWLEEDEERVYLVDVTDDSRLSEVQEVLEILDLEDVIEAKQVGRRIVIDGKIETIGQLESYRKLVDHWPSLVDLVRMDPAVMDEIAEMIQKALLDAEIETVHVRAVGGTLFLEGSVTDEEERRMVEAIIRAIYGAVDSSELQID